MQYFDLEYIFRDIEKIRDGTAEKASHSLNLIGELLMYNVHHCWLYARLEIVPNYDIICANRYNSEQCFGKGNEIISIQFLNPLENNGTLTIPSI